jgi:hypothetical protein
MRIGIVAVIALRPTIPIPINVPAGLRGPLLVITTSNTGAQGHQSQTDYRQKSWQMATTLGVQVRKVQRR